jgi:hypothetical protein
MMWTTCIVAFLYCCAMFYLCDKDEDEGVVIFVGLTAFTLLRVFYIIILPLLFADIN